MFENNNLMIIQFNYVFFNEHFFSHLLFNFLRLP